MSEHAAETRSADAVQRCIISECNLSYGIRERIYVCSRCGGPLEIQCRLESCGDANVLRKQWTDRASSNNPRDRSGVWRYRELLPFDFDVPIVSLFEGSTPLYDAPRSAEYCGLQSLQVKHLGCNPTGSFKDAGMTTAVTHAALLGVRTVVCASTGNTAASLAAYAARAGMQCAIVVPQGQVTAAKLAQSMDYGAAVLEIDGNFDDAMRLVQELADDASIYLANSINPFRIEGQKTVAFELLQQCEWKLPEHVVVPGGNMGNSSALAKGFDELLQLGLIDRLPKLHVIQAEGSAPMAHMFAAMEKNRRHQINRDTGYRSSRGSEDAGHRDQNRLTDFLEEESAWRVALRRTCACRKRASKSPTRRRSSGATASAVSPPLLQLLLASAEWSRSGNIGRAESVVAVLTGHVLKDPDYVNRYHNGTLSLGSSSPIIGGFANPPERVAAKRA